MARENQGLQIALIIFFMLTIVLSVTTFMFFNEYDQANKKAAKALDDAAQANTKATVTLKDNASLKAIVGAKEQESVKAVEEAFLKEMTNYAKAYGNEDQVYRKVVKLLYDDAQRLNEQLAGSKLEVQALEQRLETREGQTDAQVAVLQSATDKANKDKTDVAATYAAERDRAAKVQASIQTRLQRAQQLASAKLDAVGTRLSKANERVDELSGLVGQQREKIEAISKETIDTPDGEVRWVNQRNGTVWINLGRADGLRRQTTFSVYPADITNLADGGSKASIEVTQIEGEHSAVARIIEDKISDPVMIGDKIHTPIWSPGELRRFALTGFIDIDGDGKSDDEVVANLIRMNGGVVDSVKEMSINTRYLVVGDEPRDKDAAGLAKHSKMSEIADEKGIEKISINKLLEMMGWKNRTHTITYGRGSNPNDFRAKPPGGVTPKSTGNVSGRFKERRPPIDKPAKRSAF